MCYLLVFTFFYSEYIFVCFIWAHFRFNVELSLYPRQHWLLYPSVSLGNLTWPYNCLKLWLLRPRSMETGHLQAQLTRADSKVGSFEIRTFKVNPLWCPKKVQIEYLHIAQICWKMTRSLLQLVCVCVKTAYTCSLQESVLLSDYLNISSSLSFLDDKS